MLPVARTPLLLSFAAALCFACTAEPGKLATSGAGGASNSGASSTAASAVSSTGAVATSSSSSGTPFVCDPPAEPGSLYALSDMPQFGLGDPVSMCEFRGDVLLLVNAAAV